VINSRSFTLPKMASWATSGTPSRIASLAGDESSRAAAVAAYAAALGSRVPHRSGEHLTRALIETRGVIAGYPVHVYTLAEAADEQEQR
jgi:hypothetical protein